MRVVIAAGGTGGHIYPAIAYAKAIQSHDPDGQIVFVGTGKAVERDILSQEGFPVQVISVEGFVGKSMLSRCRALWLLPQSLWQAMNILRSPQADLVIGTGGYFSPPVIIAAWLLQIPRVILEPNAMPGLANRLLGPVVNRIFLAFESARSFFSSSKVRVIGTPIRQDFVLDHVPIPPQQIKHVLIFGGSQGAEAINSAMLEALDQSEILRKSVTITHQTGADDWERVQQAYQQRGLQAVVQPFLFDMPKELAKADLVICRAGASTLAELAAYGKVGILIPFPYATHNHQEMNARAMEQAGAARMVKQADLTGKILVAEIECMMQDIPAFQAMSQKSWETRKVDATEHMVRECLALACS